MKPIILLVEDEPSIREIVADTLLEAGYICIPAGTGSDALRIIEAGLYKFDLLLSDVKMPGDLNGLQLAEKFQALFPGTPVIIMSGHVDPETAAARTKDNFQVFVKPLRLPQLLEIVESALATQALAVERLENGSNEDGTVVSFSEASAALKKD